jgi:hypothetical protein
MRGVVLAECDLERRGASVIISADKGREGKKKGERGKEKERRKAGSRERATALIIGRMR